MKAICLRRGPTWTDVIDQVKSAGKWPDKFWPARPAAHGVAAANWPCSPKPNADSPRPTTRPPAVSVLRAIAWYLAWRAQGNSAVALLEIQTTHPEPKVAAALGSPAEATTAEPDHPAPIGSGSA